MRERHKIYVRRLAGQPKPWTTDPVLQNYRFCNVYRELDTVTQWIRTRLREPYADHPDLWFLMAAARQINWPETLHEMLLGGVLVPGKKGWRPEAARQVMLRRQARGDKLYTGAYMLNAHGRGPEDPSDKAFFTCHLVLDSVWQNRDSIRKAFAGRTMEGAWRALLPHHGWGGFTAYEVVCDARFTRYGANWTDIDSWSNAGPGAKRGLYRLLDEPVSTVMSQDRALPLMRHLHATITKTWLATPALELREIEHSLCEFDKFERARLNQGRPRARYQGV